MKMLHYNYISAACFLLSSSAVLFIPFLSFEKGFPGIAYFLAGIFWVFILAGIGIQIYLSTKVKRSKSANSFKIYKIIFAVIFVISLMVFICMLVFFRTNPIALPLNLFVVLFGAESFVVIRRMEMLS